MSKRQVYLIYNREEKQYYAGTNENIPLWADEADFAKIYTNSKDADMEYEILKQLGYDVEVR